MTVLLASGQQRGFDGDVGAKPVPIDHEHLARYTLGDRGLEVEILQLFADQAPLTLAALKAAECGKTWHMAAHTLKGSARAVGANRLANAAQAAEMAGHGHALRDDLIAKIEATLAEAADYVNELRVPA